MFGLILSIIGIALMAGVLYAGISYIEVDAYTSELQETTINNDLYIYSTLIHSYKSAYNVYPSTATWESDLKKLRGIVPLNNEGYYSYEYNTADYTVALCYSKSVDKTEYENAILEVHSRGTTVLANTCFQNNDQSIDTSSYPINIALTHWIKE